MAVLCVGAFWRGFIGRTTGEFCVLAATFCTPPAGHANRVLPSFDSVSIGCQISRPTMALHEDWPDFQPKGCSAGTCRTANWAPPDPIVSHAARVAACTGLADVLYKHHRCFNSFTFDRMTGPHGMRMNDKNHATTPRSMKPQHLP
jgi:hypothetical protein